MTGREPNPNSDQGGARRETDLAVVVLASAFSPRSQAALRSTRAILRSQVACGAINGVIAAIGTITVTSMPEIQLQAHFFGIALGNDELEACVRVLPAFEHTLTRLVPLHRTNARDARDAWQGAPVNAVKVSVRDDAGRQVATLQR